MHFNRYLLLLLLVQLATLDSWWFPRVGVLCADELRGREHLLEVCLVRQVQNFNFFCLWLLLLLLWLILIKLIIRLDHLLPPLFSVARLRPWHLQPSLRLLEHLDLKVVDLRLRLSHVLTLIN